MIVSEPLTAPIAARRALDAFLVDNQELEQLTARLSAFNLFNVLRIDHVEIRHSNVLAWLLTPGESHGLGPTFLRRFLSRLLMENDGAAISLSPAQVELMSFNDVEVLREWQNIDILAHSQAGGWRLLIENKIHSGEGKGQPLRYLDRVQRDSPDRQITPALVPVLIPVAGKVRQNTLLTPKWPRPHDFAVLRPQRPKTTGQTFTYVSKCPRRPASSPQPSHQETRMKDPPPPENRPVTVRLADLSPEPLEWLWPDRIPLSKVSLFIGEPAVGKSLLALDIAARVSAGVPWPDRPSEPNPPAGVLLLASANNLADTVLPRLVAAGASLDRITAVTSLRTASQEELPRPLWRLSLRPTLAHLDALLQENPDCRLLVLDPFTRFLTQLHSPNSIDAQVLIESLADLAARHRITVLAVCQASRNATGFTWQRAHTRFAADSARTIWALAEDSRKGSSPPRSKKRTSKKGKRSVSSQAADQSSPKLFLPIKTNVTAHVPPLACSIAVPEGADAPRILWHDETLPASPGELLDRRTRTLDQSDAVAWLRELLTEGPCPATEVLQQGKDNGFAERGVRRAYTTLACIRKRRGKGPNAVWIWALPDDEKRLTRFRLDPLTELDLEHQTMLREFTDS